MTASGVARTEDVLAVYQRPYDPTAPVVCMDEQPVQLVKETRQPIPAAPGRPVRIDYEYERNGTANIFMFTEPLAGWRAVPVTDRRTKVLGPGGTRPARRPLPRGADRDTGDGQPEHARRWARCTRRSRRPKRGA